MAQSQLKVDTVIKGTFPIQVAVRCTKDAEAVCWKNRLSFSDLLKPFSQLSTQVQLKDIQGHLYSLRNMRVRFSEPQTEPSPDSKQRMVLNNVVHGVTGGRDGKLGPWLQLGSVTTLAMTPWYDQYRDMFMDTLNQSDHECIRHYISVLLVVSSAHPNPTEAFSQLYTRQKESEQSRHPKWLTPHLYYYHVLLHDVTEGNHAQAHDNFQKTKAAYGDTSCYLLQINSRAPGMPAENIPDPWNQFVSLGQSGSSGEDETDFSLKFKRDKKKDDSVSSSSVIPSNGPRGEEDSSDIIKPNDAREEAQLIDSDSNESLSDELIQTSSSVSLEVEPGRDPLTQLAAEQRPESPQGTTPSSSVNYRGSLSPAPSYPSKSHAVGQCLSLEDHNSLRTFVREFVCLRLLPHMEAVLKNLNEWLLSRKSVRRSITSMGNRLMKMFGGAPTPNSTLTEEQQSFSYSSLELQTRQLADLAFLLQNYDLAFQTYHSVKKDFQGSSMWLHYAGAVEMCGVSAYMLSPVRREVVSYLEEAISVYNITCKLQTLALRSSLLLCEVLKERGQYRDLTQLYIKMTAEDADLRSALCLEQAAHAFLRIQPSFSRKYALHLILAGHRYAKAVQRVHSTRVYRQALEVYHNRGWTLAEDYIHFSLARHAFSLRQLREAKLAFEHLLAHESEQTPTQQLQNLKEFVFVHRQLLNSDEPRVGNQVPLDRHRTSKTSAEWIKDVPLLPLPFVRSKYTQVLFATGMDPRSVTEDVRTRKQKDSHDSHLKEEKQSDLTDLISDSRTVDSNMKHSPNLSLRQRLRQSQEGEVGSLGGEIIGARDYEPGRWVNVLECDWEELECRAAGGCQGVPRENFTPSVLWRDNCGDNSKMTSCVIGEPIGVRFLLKNPLSVPLHMSHISLTWLYSHLPRSNEDPSSPTVSNMEAETEVLERFVLQSEEERTLTLHITPMKEGELKVLGFIYNICVDSSQQRGSESPSLPSAPSRTNLPSLAVSSRDTLYQKHQGLSSEAVQEILSTGVQGRVDVSVRGPRLNNTKLEKASVVYGADHRLHWVVTSPMPKIVTYVSCPTRPLLAGEMRPVTVEVYNCGQVPLNSLRITSNLSPRLLFVEDKTTALPLGGPIYPSGPSSFSILPPSKLHPQCIEIPLSHGRLERGEGVRANLLIQGVELATPSGWAAEIPWNLVFYYEPAVITASSRLSHRVLRHSRALQVKDSLYVNATSVHGQLPTARDSSIENRLDINRLVITVEVKNRCQIVESSAIELKVVQISSVSRRWRVRKMDREQGEMTLYPSEGGVVLLEASRLEKEDVEEGAVCFSDVSLGRTVLQSSQFPAADLLFGTKVFRSLLAPSTEEARQVGGGPEVGADPQSAHQDDVALIVFWQATIPSASHVTHGHHTVSVTLPQSMASLAEGPASHPPSPYDLVKFHLDHPAVCRHDFSTSCLCQVPVNVTLQNCCQARLEVALELSHPREIGSPPNATKGPRHAHSHHSHHTPHQESPFVWTGGTCRRHFSLEANSTQTVLVYAHFNRPGVYSLGHVRVLASFSGEQHHVQRWQRTSTITIE